MIQGSEVRKADHQIEPLLLDRWSPRAMSGEEISREELQSDESIIVAAQERLALQNYYRGETDGVLSPETQKAIKRYQTTNGLRQTGQLDNDTLATMGLSNGTSY